MPAGCWMSRFKRVGVPSRQIRMAYPRRDNERSFEREVDELVIHGVLHLCGYDHETDRGQMNRLELKLRRKLLDPK